MELDELRKDCARRQKKGLHFILASIVIWSLILATQLPKRSELISKGKAIPSPKPASSSVSTNCCTFS